MSDFRCSDFRCSDFRCEAPYQPTGDQPQAIAALVRGLEANLRYQTLLGATGTGKTHTIARVIERVGRPTLVLAHNKTLAAQLCNELRSFFPHNAVEYFISYYDYYQPEAYIPVSDTYIAKTASINDEIDMLRHSATRSLFERRDVIVVASISCIYGLGIPSEYLKAAIPIRVGEEKDPRQIIRDLVNVQYSRNDLELGRGRFRIKGDVLEIGPAYEDRIIRVEFFGDEIDAIRYVDPVTGEILQSLSALNIYPARHFVTPEDRLEDACNAIKQEMDEQLAALQTEGKLVEAQRLDQRTRYDLEMLREVGYCNGVENYSRHLAGRGAGEPPECLLDYFPKDWLLVMDESHVTVPQLRGMYNGDQARKKVLIDHGFRLPSAADNRPLKAEEFWTKVGQCIFVSATPGDWELEQSSGEFKPIVATVPGLDVALEQAEFERSLSPSLTVSEAEGQYDSDSSNPNQSETSQSKTTQSKITQSKTSKAKTGKAKTSDAKTSDAKTSDAKTSDAKTSKARLGQAEVDSLGHTTANAIDSSSADATARPAKADKPVPKLYQRGTGHVVEQVIRPTGVVDPEIFVRPTEGQVDDLYGEIQQRVAKGERTLITTLTKRMAEDLTEYFQERSVRVRYLHSEISSIERIEIIQDLRDGVFDVLIGVNLLREGLDLPEVSLVAILDADKEGFLRAERSLIQTIGRAARHVSGQAILYADNMTNSMARAIAETERRRAIQIAYNEKHGITPQPIAKRVGNSILAFLEVSRRLNAQELATAYDTSEEIPLSEIPELITQLEAQMKDAAKNLDFEEAAKYRDKIKILREKLVGKR